MATTEESLEETYERYRRSRRRQRIWAADNPGNVAIRDELLAQVRKQAGPRLPAGRVLDVGCGGGWLLRELHRDGVADERLHGVELIQSRIDAARRALPAADIRHADAGRLPYEDESFDLVTLLTVLSSLPDTAVVPAALDEARRVLAPGGVLIVYEPRLPNPLNRATHLVTARELDHALGPGWKQVPLTVVPGLARRLGPLTRRAYPLLARIRPLLTHRLVVLVDER